MSIRYRQYHKEELKFFVSPPAICTFPTIPHFTPLQKTTKHYKECFYLTRFQSPRFENEHFTVERPSFLINRPITQLLTVLNFFYEVLSQSKVKCLFLKVNVRNIRKDEMFLCLCFSRFCFSLFFFSPYVCKY